MPDLPPAETRSPYPDLEPPTFTSKVPDYLMAGGSDQDKWLVEQMSLNNQMTEYLMHTLFQTYGYVKSTNGRTRANSDDIVILKQTVNELQTEMAKVKPVTRIIAGTWRFVSKKPVAILLGLALFYIAFYLYPYLLKEDPLTLLGRIVKASFGL